MNVDRHYTPNPSIPNEKSDELTVRFQLQLEDFIAFADFDRSRPLPIYAQPKPLEGRRQRTNTLQLLTCGFVVAYVATMFLLPPQVVEAFQRFAFQFLGVIGGMIFVVVTFLYNNARFRNRSIRNAFEQSLRYRRSGSTQATITSEGLLTRNCLSSSCTNWSGILEIAETDLLLCFYIDLRDAILIPKRAFQAENESRAFVTLAQRYHQQLGPSIEELTSGNTSQAAPS